MMNDFAGVDVEKQVDHVVAYVAPYIPADPQAQGDPEIPRALVLVQGSFDTARIEAFIRERAGAMDEYKGRKIFVRTDAMKATSVTGVFACGDSARAAGNVALAVADGAMAGVGAHRLTIFGAQAA